jgi:hypothetical protein
MGGGIEESVGGVTGALPWFISSHNLSFHDTHTYYLLLLSPFPSLFTMVLNNYNLGRMGCSVGLISIDLATVRCVPGSCVLCFLSDQLFYVCLAQFFSQMVCGHACLLLYFLDDGTWEVFTSSSTSMSARQWSRVMRSHVGRRRGANDTSTAAPSYARPRMRPPHARD